MLLAAYLPIDRYIALCQNLELPESTTGTVLFADISGFTPLTEILTLEMGPRLGGEELTRHLNQIYETLINQVSRYHGSVINFSGDAITCWFDGTQDPRKAAHQAVTAAMLMQTEIQKLAQIVTPKGQSLSLALKVTVASGLVRRFVVGDPRFIKLDVLAGATLDHLSSANSLVQKNEVVVTSEVKKLLGDYLEIKEWRYARGVDPAFGVVRQLKQTAPIENWPLLPSDDLLPLAEFRAWMLPAVYERLTESPEEFLTELRPAVALFLQFEGLDYDNDEKAGAKLDSFIRWVEEVVTYYEGNLLEISIGDKGSYLYMIFGAPISHENEAERAVRAALELSNPPSRPELAWLKHLKIGLGRGVMRTGAYGSTTRRTYGVLGDGVNLAARLMQLAKPGEILVSDRIQKGLEQIFNWEILASVEIKGKSKPVIPYSLKAARTRSTVRGQEETNRNLQIVGREVETRQLIQALQALPEGKNQVIIIEGEAGIGKSRLVAYLWEQARKSQVQTLIGAGDLIARTTGYYAWRLIINGFLELNDSIESLDLQTRIARYFSDAPEKQRFIPLLNDVLPLSLPDNELTSQLSGQNRAENTRELLLHFLTNAIGSRPTLLVLEDAHWLDSASWALVQELHQRISTLLLVLVTRPMEETAPDEYKQLKTTPLTKTLQLTSLPFEEITSLICQCLQVSAGDLPETVARFIYSKAEGHPFFSEELTYSLRDAGLITIENGICRLASGAEDLAAFNFPDTVEDVITSRLDHLTSPQQLTLKVASVIGRVFPFRTLRDIYPGGITEVLLENYLLALERLNLTHLDKPRPELIYLFKHIITQEVTYNLMLFAQRRELHRAVAEWYEKSYSDRLAIYYPVLAYHWGKAEVADKTLEYLEKAGVQAARNGASQEAIEFLTQTISLNQQKGLVQDALRQAHWERLLVEAYVSLGNWTESYNHLKKGLLFLGWPLPEQRQKLLLSTLKETASFLVFSLARLKRGWRWAKANNPDTEKLLEGARLYDWLWQIAFIDNNNLFYFYAILRNTNLNEAAASSPYLPKCYANLSLLLGLSRLPKIASSYYRRGLSAASRANDLDSLAWLKRIYGMLSVCRGDWVTARKELEEAIKLYEEFADRQKLTSMIILSNNFYFHGEFISCYNLTRQINTLALQYNAVQPTLVNLLNLITCAIVQGKFSEAQECLEKARSLVTEQTTHLYRLFIYALEAQLFLYLENKAAAANSLEQAIHLLAQPYSSSGGYLIPFNSIAEVCFSLWETQHPLGNQSTREPSPLFPNIQLSELMKFAKKLCSAFRQLAFLVPIAQPHAYLYQGWYEWLSNEPGKAYKLWQKGLVAAKKLDMPYEQGRIHYELARHLPASDPERRLHLEQAAEIFAQLSNFQVTFE
jgi:class 3 adenylate cyclase/Tfp pilus assembly protein PilF